MTQFKAPKNLAREGVKKPKPPGADTLVQLLASGEAWIDEEHTEYHGRASDGTVVNLGTVGCEDVLFSYLTTHPSPETW